MSHHRPPFSMRRMLAAYGVAVVLALVFLLAAVEGGLVQ